MRNYPKFRDNHVLEHYAYQALKKRYPDKLKCRKCTHECEDIVEGDSVHMRTVSNKTVYYHQDCWEALLH